MKTTPRSRRPDECPASRARVARVAAALACLAGAGQLACTGDPAVGPWTADVTLIDDMEGSDGVIRWMPPDGQMAGTWFTQTDCTQNQRIAPIPYGAPGGGWSYGTLPTPNVTLGWVESRHAARLRTTTPLAGVWGAVMGFNLLQSVPNPAAPKPPEPTGPDASCRQGTALDFTGGTADLTGYSGVTFWAKADPGGFHTISLRVRDWSSDPRFGICNAANPTTDGGCYNDFTFPISLGSSFLQYTVDFSTLQQDLTAGVRRDPSALDLGHVTVMSFEVDLPDCSGSSGETCAGGDDPAFSFDFWVDDLFLVRR